MGATGTSKLHSCCVVGAVWALGLWKSSSSLVCDHKGLWIDFWVI